MYLLRINTKNIREYFEVDCLVNFIKLDLNFRLCFILNIIKKFTQTCFF